MPNLRNMIDGHGSLLINALPVQSEQQLKVQDDVIIRRRISRTGPVTSQVMVGKIMAMDGTQATVSIAEVGGHKHATVNVSDLSPVTASFKRQSMQFNRQFRPSV